MAKKNYTKLHPIFATIIGFFEQLTLAIKAGEGSFVEFVVAFGPYVAPLIPAGLTYDHVVNTLGMSAFFGWSAAIAVEVLGLASGHTIASFWMHNKQNTAKRDKLPIWPITFTYVFYLSILISINVILDWGIKPAQIIIAEIALCLLTTPAIVIVAIRAQHREILLRKVEYVQQRSNMPVEQKQNRSERSIVPATVQVEQYLNKHYYGERSVNVPTARELHNLLDVPVSSAHSARRKFLANGRG